MGNDGTSRRRKRRTKLTRRTDLAIGQWESSGHSALGFIPPPRRSLYIYTGPCFFSPPRVKGTNVNDRKIRVSPRHESTGIKCSEGKPNTARARRQRASLSLVPPRETLRRTTLSPSLGHQTTRALLGIAVWASVVLHAS